MEKWLKQRLSHCLNFEVPDDMIKYILQLKSTQEFDTYFDSLLNKNSEDHRLFLTDCKQRLFSKALPNKKNQSQQFNNNPSPQHGKKSQPPSAGTAAIKQNQNPPIPSSKQQFKIQENQQQPNQGVKKKNKYVNLYSNDGKVSGDAILLKGQRICECQASQHKLINNCLKCGRIVCEQEGSGPCVFCGELVYTNEELESLKTASKKSGKVDKKNSSSDPLKKALEQRDRLLEYDRNSEKRTTVIDDELDYFQENSVWLSEAEREKFESLKQEMHEKKHTGRAQRKIKIDFAGREIEENLISQEYEKRVLKEIAATTAAEKNSSDWANNAQKITSDTCENDNPLWDGIRPVYMASEDGERNSRNKLFSGALNGGYNRVQDKELLEMQDMRHCLSMHQPWASLLIAGIKKHEGRVWYSGHRGRLWIASTAKEPKQDEIQELENFYKNYYNDPHIVFPKHYPSGCLLGCVIVQDCLAQEEYRDIYPNGESESPYVFICTHPEELPVVFPIKGQHKIYQIDPKIHNAACKTLLRSKVIANKN